MNNKYYEQLVAINYHIKGLMHLFESMDDGPVVALEAIEMATLLRSPVEQLDKILEDAA